MAADDPPRRFALLLVGLIGSLHKRASRGDHQRSIKNAPFEELASPRIIRYATMTHRALVLDANEPAGGVDVFAHSWNPLAGAFLDAQFGDRMRLSAHEPIEHHTSGRSHALSVGRGGQLVRAFERMHNHSYETVLVLRTDLFLTRAVDLREVVATASDGGELLWFASKCCTSPPNSSAEAASLAQQCGAQAAAAQAAADRRSPPQFESSTAASQHQRAVGLFKHGCSGAYYAGTARPPPLDVAYFLPDWWLAARAHTVASWTSLAEQWEAYSCALQQLMRHTGPSSGWSHFRWPVHVHDALGLTGRMRFTRAVSGTMARTAFTEGWLPPEELPAECAAAFGTARARRGRGGGGDVGAELDDVLELRSTAPDGHAQLARHRARDLELAPVDVRAPQADQVLAHMGLDRRFAAMARACPWTELSVRRSLGGAHAPLAHCAEGMQPVGLVLGTISRACALPAPAREGPHGGRYIRPELRQFLGKFQDGLPRAWRRSVDQAQRSVAGERGRHVRVALAAARRALLQPGGGAHRSATFTSSAVGGLDAELSGLETAAEAIAAEMYSEMQLHLRGLKAAAPSCGTIGVEAPSSL